MRADDRVVILELLERRVREAKNKAKKEWFDNARPGDRNTAMIGDEKLGSITYRAGAEKMRLVDSKALLDWCVENAPHLVSYEPHLPAHHLDALKNHPVNEKTGELLPGFEPSHGDPGSSVRLADGAADVLGRAISSGALSFDEVLEIEQ